MKTYILATVGTSLLTNLRKELGWPQDELPDPRKAVAFLKKRQPSERVCGAEINSINHLLQGQKTSVGTVEKPVEIHFLVSDTPEGEWSGRVLKLYFEGWPKDSVEKVGCTTVQRLQDADAQAFAHHGLRNLVKEAARLLADAQRRAPHALRLIDATGGYKAQISFATLLGQAFGVPVVYLFERFPHCIEMPPLPVSFDRSLWIEHYWLFKKLSDELCLPADQVRRSDVDDRLWQLLDHETVDGVECIALSPILEVMHQGFELRPPEALQEPPPSDRPPEQKLRINEAEMAHAPHNSRKCMERLARLPWVTRVENIRFVNTAQSKVKSGATDAVDEILVVYSDGNKGIEIKLSTTCRLQAQRQWCLEQLRRQLS